MLSLSVWISGLLFALIHSIFAANGCKQWFYKLGMTPQRYRFLYSVFAILLTGIWILYVFQLSDEPLYQIKGWLNWVLVFIQLSGLWVVFLSLKAFDAKIFLGIHSAAGQDEPFHEHGVYRYVRHPMYSGVMLALLASPVQTVNGLSFVLCICCYFIIGSNFEERRMLRIHPEYADYKKRVPAFVPWRALF